ncbi:MAG: SPFH domain-containing protein [bacterium]
MGLFSDTCHALIDRTTSKALRGEALEKAKQDPTSPRCGSTVKRAARFCSKCGTGAPGGWWQCPDCKKWVGNESNFCWNCKKPLHPESRDAVAGGAWQRTAGVFAERFEVGDVKRLLEKGFTIETGTAAILLDGGAFKDVLGPGRHNVDSLAHKINWWGNEPSRTIVLVENGDVVLPLRVEGLRSSEDMPLEFYSEVAFHFTEKGAADFIANLFKNSQQLGYSDLQEKLSAEIRYAVESLCVKSTADDLVKDPQRRLQIEDALQTTLKTALERYGLEIVRVASTEFTGPEYEALRAKSGEIEIKRRQFEFDQRMRELVLSEGMHQFKSEQDLGEYVAQLAQERNVSSEHRDHELAILRMVHRHELDEKEAAFAMAREMEKAGHEIGIKIKWDDYTRDKLLKDAQAEAEVTGIWLKVKEERKRIKREHEAEVAKIREGMSLQTLVSMTDDPAKRADLIRLGAQLQAQGKSADEILALQAAQNPDVVRVLAERERGKREDREKDWEERKKLLDEASERLERILKAALETTAEAAKHPGSNTQIVK